MNCLSRVRIGFIIIMIVSLTLPVSALAKSNAVDMYEVYEVLQNNHVSGISEDELTSAAIRAMIEELDDPYTEYYSEEEWQSFSSALNQDYVGIGVRLAEDDKGIYAVEVFPNSPAQEKGILNGDYFIAVEGQTVEGLTI